MDFQERIDGDIKEAMKARQATRLGVLRMLKSALKNAAIEQGGAEARLDEASAQAVLRKEAKKRQDSIEGFTKGGRQDLADKEQEELGVLSDYLPKQLSPEELEALVSSVMAELGATSKAQMGLVMKAATALVEERLNLRVVAQRREQLNHRLATRQERDLQAFLRHLHQLLNLQAQAVPPHSEAFLQRFHGDAQMIDAFGFLRHATLQLSASLRVTRRAVGQASVSPA